MKYLDIHVQLPFLLDIHAQVPLFLIENLTQKIPSPSYPLCTYTTTLYQYIILLDYPD